MVKLLHVHLLSHPSPSHPSPSLGWTRSGAWKQERGWFWFSGSGGVFEFPVMSPCQASICPGTMVLMSSFTLLGGGGVTTLNKRNESPLWNTGLQCWSGKWVKQRRPGTKHSAYVPVFSLRKHWRSRGRPGTEASIHLHTAICHVFEYVQTNG